jgi:Carboxypeptidase regulatory-like domain
MCKLTTIHAARLMLCVAFSAGSASAASLTVVLHLAGPSRTTTTPAVQAVVHVEPTSMLGGHAVPPVTRTVDVPTTTAVKVPAGLVYEVSAESSGWWVERLAVYVPPSGATASLALWPVGSVEGVITPPSDAKVQVLRLRFQPTEAMMRQGLQPSGKVDCPIRQDDFACALPAGRYHLSLRVPGFVPHYRWDVGVSTGRTTSLGRFGLVRGSSLIGFVKTDDGAADPHTCTVELRPCGTDYTGHSDNPGRRATAAAKVSPNQWGYFVFDGVAPGCYGIAVAQPGYAQVMLPHLTVLPEAEARITKDIVLQRPITMRVQVSPVTDLEQQPWRVDASFLDTATGEWKSVARGGVAGASGEFTKAGLSPGRYRVIVLNATNDRVGTALVDLERDSPPVQIGVAYVTVEGQLQLADEPLAGRLDFGGRSGVVRVSMTSDRDGHFTGVLPHAGKWLVDVSSDDPHVERSVRDVEVPQRSGNEAASVNITLPDQRLRGSVVDPEGVEVFAASVELVDYVNGAAGHTSTDREGRFSFAGLDPGTYAVQASDLAPEGERTSAPDTVLISSEGTPPAVTLVLHRVGRLQGRVVGPEGQPVSGASLFVLPDASQGYVPVAFEQATTDPTGQFKLEVPIGPSSFNVLVEPPGFSLAIARLGVSHSTGEENEVRVDRYGGTLVIWTDKDLDWRDPSMARPVLWWNDVFVSTIDLFFPWVRAVPGDREATEGRIVVPRVGPGVFRACLLVPAQGLQAMAGMPLPAGTACSTGTLNPFGELVLDLRAK